MTLSNRKEPRQVYTPKEYMDLTGLCKTAVYQGIERGEIPSIRIGRRILVLKSPVDKQLNGETDFISTEKLGVTK
jgi:excisionase family DNA binding protein